MTTARVRHVSDVPALGSITVYDDATARTADDTVLTRHELHRLHHAVEQAMWAADRQSNRRRSLRRPTTVADELTQLADQN